MPQEHQLASGTAGRAALDGYSWRQAAHWVHGAGLYVATHGPRFGETTLRLVEVLAELTPCRPTIAHLMRRLKCSKRTVQYHLQILRATGLLAWRSIGTRLPMTKGQTRVESLASEYERLIPPSYDRALGIRTAGEGLERRMVGISEEGRTVIAELGKKAAKKPRRVRRTVRHSSTERAVSTSRCTPMVGTTHLVSSSSVGDQKTTGDARVTKSITRKKPTGKLAGERRRTVLGQVVTAAMMAAGDLMARVAYRRVPWVRQASHDQLRWVLNDIADRGWSPERAVAWLVEISSHYGAGALWRPERPHALIAHALRQETEQVAYDQELRQDIAARVGPMDNAAMRELAGLAGLFALMDTPAPTPESDPAEETLARAHWAPRTVVAAIDDNVDAAIDRYGVDLVARYAGLAASPNVQIGVR
ncbi:hypothetical protein [Kitasatospora griseola]|uniref:hypothetical protein n=1 Tax=Kitasatospora griseola TaxID=2064 RepID=UPI00166FF589|nr:hypothetical protein [Kitasatospora griseola]GGR04216.1 hypothetical protein GCM10010195_69620 [Kitasatospora griseola]